MATTQAANGPVLELRGISKRYGGAVALDGVDFDLLPGEVHGLIGENGAGKSTMMKLLSGVYDDYSGELLLGGRPQRFASPAEAWTTSARSAGGTRSPLRPGCSGTATWGPPPGSWP